MKVSQGWYYETYEVDAHKREYSKLMPSPIDISKEKYDNVVKILEEKYQHISIDLPRSYRINGGQVSYDPKYHPLSSEGISLDHKTRKGLEDLAKILELPKPRR
jgi:hypothetical protein